MPRNSKSVIPLTTGPLFYVRLANLYYDSVLNRMDGHFHPTLEFIVTPYKGKDRSGKPDYILYIKNADTFNPIRIAELRLRKTDSGVVLHGESLLNKLILSPAPSIDGRLRYRLDMLKPSRRNQVVDVVTSWYEFVRKLRQGNS